MIRPLQLKSKTMKKLLFSIFDHSGNSAKPFKENGWTVVQVDIKHGIDIMEWDYVSEFKRHIGMSDVLPEVGLIIMIPCTDYALSGARHFKAKDSDGRTEKSQKLVAKSKEIIDFFDKIGVLRFWQIENPMSRIHSLNPWMGKPRLKFNPCDYAGYDPNPEKSRYNKRTWLWGNFYIPEKKYLEPFEKESPVWKYLGGKSEKTKELRSITPMGFAYAFAEANC
jgi:hypothetical protein